MNVWVPDGNFDVNARRLETVRIVGRDVVLYFFSFYYLLLKLYQSDIFLNFAFIFFSLTAKINQIK